MDSTLAAYLYWPPLKATFGQQPLWLFLTFINLSWLSLTYFDFYWLNLPTIQALNQKSNQKQPHQKNGRPLLLFIQTKKKTQQGFFDSLNLFTFNNSICKTICPPQCCLKLTLWVNGNLNPHPSHNSTQIDTNRHKSTHHLQTIQALNQKSNPKQQEKNGNTIRLNSCCTT